MAKTSKATPKNQPHSAIEKVDPRTLRADPNQPRRNIDPDAVDDMAASIRQVGLAQPPTIDENDIVRLGEIRWQGSLKAGLKTILVRRVVGHSAESWLLLQAVEKFQRTDLSDEDSRSLLLRLRDARREGRLPGLEDPGSEKPETPRSGRPKGFEPGSNRDLAAMVGKPKSFVTRLLVETYIAPEDIPDKLHPALEKGHLTEDAVIRIRRRCPEQHREALIDKIEEEATRGQIKTEGVRAVIDGLREVTQRGGDGDTAKKLVNLIEPGVPGSFTAARVQVIVPQTPEERMATDARDERSFVAALNDTRRQLIAERTVILGRHSTDARTIVKRLVHAGQQWLESVARHPPEKSGPSLPPGDVHITTDLDETARLVLGIIIARTHLFGEPVGTAELVGGLLFHTPRPAIQRLEELGLIDEQQHSGPDQWWAVNKERHFLFSEGAYVPLKEGSLTRLRFTR